MDTEAYPREDVKKFFAPMIMLKHNPELGKVEKAVADKYSVNSFPRLIVITPTGEVIKEIKGSPQPHSYEASFTNDYWNKYVGGQDSNDMKTMATNLWMLVTWYPESKYGKEAQTVMKRHEADAVFKSTWDELQKNHVRGMLAAKADAQLKLNKKKEATESYKQLATDHPGTKEGDEALKVLKKLGVKFEDPAKK